MNITTNQVRLEELWVSDCGHFYAYRRGGDKMYPWTGLDYDVIDMRRSIVWLSRRYEPTGWDDKDPRYVYPEFSRSIGVWSNRGRRTRAGKWIPAFELAWSVVDRTVKTFDFDKRSYSEDSGRATFRRKIHNRYTRLYRNAAILVNLALLQERVTNPNLPPMATAL
jgi:hypothetical protein